VPGGRTACGLPVTGADDQLIGIVSRRDLLSVFLRPDAEIVGEVRHLLDEMPFGNPVDVTMTVRHGVVTLAGAARPAPGRHQDLGSAAIRLIWDVDGVVDVVNRTTEGEGPGETGKSALAGRIAAAECGHCAPRRSRAWPGTRWPIERGLRGGTMRLSHHP
jgi:CBS domain-containing protein